MEQSPSQASNAEASTTPGADTRSLTDSSRTGTGNADHQGYTGTTPTNRYPRLGDFGRHNTVSSTQPSRDHERQSARSFIHASYYYHQRKAVSEASFLIANPC